MVQQIDIFLTYDPNYGLQSYHSLMLNFASLFNQFRPPPNSSIADILSSPNPSLMRLLDDDNFATEFKTATARVQQFMTYKRYAQLVQLITEVGDPMDKKRSYKFPLIVCQMLISDNPVIGEVMLSNKGSITIEQKIIKTTQEEVEQIVEDDEEGEQNGAKWEGGEEVPKSEASADEEQFGEFVQAPPPKKKVVKVKQVVETTQIVTKEFPLLIERLFAYFEGEVNYTLTGYVCRVLTSLLNKKPPQFLGKFFADEKIPQNLLNHVESRSTVDLLVRIFTIQNDLLLAQRLEYYFSMVHRLSNSNQIEVSSNLSVCACEVFEKLATHFKTINPIKELREYINSIPDLLKFAVNNVIGEDQNSSVYSVPLVYQLINSLPVDSDQSLVQESLKLLIEGGFQKLRKSTEEVRPRLGIGRVKLVEIIGFLLKRVWVREWIVSKQNFFPVLLSLVRQYPLNNILHNQVFKIFGNVLNFQKAQDLDVKLLENLLSGDKLLLWLGQQAQQEAERLTKDRYELPKGYAGHLVKLCKQLKQAANKTELIKALVQDSRFIAAIKTLIQKQIIGNQRNLAGYTMLKNNKYQIMFSKEQILAHHANFLAKSPPPVFVANPDDPMEDPRVLQQLQRQLDGVSDENVNKPLEVIEEEKRKAELIDENDQNKSAFWKVHLEYDVDALLDEMI